MGMGARYRHELKYLCSELQVAIVRSRLSALMRLDSHAKGGSYTVRSVYFDGYGNRCLRENEDGTDPREKFRIRIYDSSDSRISFECKRKERGRTHKASCLISRGQCEAILRGRVPGLTGGPELLRRLAVLARTELFRPVVVVEYDRTPYVHDAGNVRVTLDRNIRSSDDCSGFLRDHIATRPVLPRGQHVLEVKYDELLPGFIKDALQLGDLRQTRFSKYYLSRKHSLGGLL